MYFYRVKDNFIYDFNPLTISLFCLLAGILAFIVSHPFYLGAVLLAVILVIIASGNVKMLKGYLYYSFFLFFLIILINVVFSPGGHTVWASLEVGGKEWFFTLEALVYGLAMGIRLLAVIGVFCLFNCVVDPDWLFDFFSIKGGKFSVLGNLSLRLFLVTVNDFRRISQIQSLRGFDYKKGGLRDKLQKGGLLLDGVLLCGLERAVEMAEAMYAKGYGEGRRSCYYNYLWRARDYIVLAAAGAGILLTFFELYKGFLRYRFYPELDMLKSGDIFLAGLIFVLFGMPAWLKWGADRWKKSKWLI